MYLPNFVHIDWAMSTVDLAGNFRVMKLLYDKFTCQKIFIGTTPYHVNVN